MISGIVAREIPPEVVATVEQHRNPKKYLKDPVTHYSYPSIKAFMDVKGDPNTLVSATVAYQATQPAGGKPPESVTKADTFPLHSLSKARDTLVDKWVANEAAQRVAARHGIGYKIEEKDKAELEAEKKAIKSDLRLMAKKKEEFNEQVYAKQMAGNIEGHLYQPAAITAEMKQRLGFSDEIPENIFDRESAMHAIRREIDQYHKLHGKSVRILSDDDLHKLFTEIYHVMNLYLKAYPEKSLEDAYVVCRDLGRVAIYQMYFDKRAFTSSDHGIRHIYHNCENGHNMHQAMAAEGDEDLKANLVSRIAHFYHDIGYSVGAANTPEDPDINFVVMRDHPFIGAAFIAANREYFNKHFGEEETKIIEHAILNHALVSFDSDVSDRYKLVRFTTSNSDACAVTADQKTQSFWVDHPETVLQLARLRMFLTIYPECAKDFKYLADSNIIDKPEVALRDWLIDPNKPKPAVFDPSNFKNEVYYKAYALYIDVKNELLNIAHQEHLPPDEQEAYEQAILHNFNSFSGDVVLKQYGAELHKVSAERNTPENINKGDPKYLPRIDIGPSVLYAYLESCYSREIAGGNLRKLLSDEYNVDERDLDESLHHAGRSRRNNISINHKVPCEVASIHVVNKSLYKPSQIKPGLGKVINALYTIQDTTVPIEFRKKLNDYLTLIAPQKNVSKPGETPRNAKGSELEAIPPESTTFYLKNLKEQVRIAYESFVEKPNVFLNQTDEQFKEFLEQMNVLNLFVAANKPDQITDEMQLKLRTFLTTDKDWQHIKTKRPIYEKDKLL